MKQTIAVLILCYLLYVAVCPAAGDGWLEKAEMPTARSNLATAVVDGRIYAIGGEIANFQRLSVVEEYNPRTDSWRKGAEMPTARRSLATGVVGERIYAIGGYSIGNKAVRIVEEYNPLTDTWTKKRDMPTARYGVSACVVNGMIYAIGGAGMADEDLATVEVYDPADDTWTKRTNMPTARFAPTVSVVNDRIYAIGGGILVNGNQDTPVPVVEEYDPMMDTWVEKSDMPGGEYVTTSSAAGGEIYVFGGLEGMMVLGLAGPAVDSVSIVRCYNPATDTWSGKTDMPTPRSGASASTIDGKIYVIGGSEGVPAQRANEVPLSVVEEYTPDGWPFAVSPGNKLASTWGEIRQEQ